MGEYLEIGLLILTSLTTGIGGIIIAKFVPGAVPILGVANKTINELVLLHKKIEQSDESILETAKKEKLQLAEKELIK